MSAEKKDCEFFQADRHRYGCPIARLSYEELSNDLKLWKVKQEAQNYGEVPVVPIGTVEFVRKYCEVSNLALPEAFGYEPVEHFLKRDVERALYQNVPDSYFIKPTTVKAFTGGIKSSLPKMDPKLEVWCCEPVPFESEFRFYIDNRSWDKSRIAGFCRYDGLDVTNPAPDLDYVNDIISSLHRNDFCSAYSLDIGWRADIEEYDVVEMNDFWSLGLYTYSDSQSQPLKPGVYAQLAQGRWRQIVFSGQFT